MRRLHIFPIGIAMAFALMIAGAASARAIEVPRLVLVDHVWSGHPVDFGLAHHRGTHYIAYYDADRRMTVASLEAGASTFQYRKLDSVTGWDSHNYLAITVDATGHLHVIGNLHNDPLVYFRTTRAGDVSSLERVAVLVDRAREQRMTYPVFIRRADGTLVLKYRDGGSGNGNEIYVAYDTGSRRWRSLLDTPLVDGEGKRNAYFVGPTLGPDGRFHLAWVWRDTPDAETNHDLSYARSRDLVNWEKSDGTPLKLPITLATAEIVDPVPVRAGMINNNTVIGFDAERRPVITYHKFDARGDTQIHLALREQRGWRVAAITRWRDFRWDFSGRGSLTSRLTVSGAIPEGTKQLAVQVVRDGKTLMLRARLPRLEPLREAPLRSLAESLADHVDVPAGMILNTIRENNSAALAWSTLPRNRDQPRTEIPAPTPLFLVL
jgi:hypothetical protein